MNMLDIDDAWFIFKRKQSHADIQTYIRVTVNVKNFVGIVVELPYKFQKQTASLLVWNSA